MMRLDHNRAVSQLANRLDVPATAVRKLTGLGQPLLDPVPRPVPRPGERHRRPQLVDQAWVHEVFIPTVGRGAAPSS